jgi:tRNA modification GTPase
VRTDDVIAAIATAWGESAIAVVRLSGAGSVHIADKFFRARSGKNLEEIQARHMALGVVADAEGFAVDEALAVRFEEGRSYTGEESVEVHCHGGIMAVQRCLELFLGCGARLALPGEFTKRAFLSGRIDLAQAEAALGVIRSKSDAALLSAERSLQGELSSGVRSLMDSLTAFRAGLEARLDYPEELDGQENSEISDGIEKLSFAASDLASRCRAGLILSGGVRVAILGRPNVGKSALLNALTGQDRAIVAATPGTTRDTVTASTVWRGLALEFVDTAGIRETSDEIEGIGIARSLAAMGGADVRLVVTDASGMTADDEEIISEATKKDAGDAAGSTLLALNKSDLLPPGCLKNADVASGAGINQIKTSALTGYGIEALKDAIFELALGSVPAEEGYAATERMASGIAEAASLLGDAKAAMKRADGIDAVGSLLAEASVAIAALLGADATEELLDAIFSNFCVGK